MERYTLNETGLLGHAALFGGGMAGQSLGASGTGHLVMQGSSVPASMDMSATGGGLPAALGVGLASMEMSATGRAYLIMRGIADIAILVLDAMADGTVIPGARGVAAMSMTALGRGIHAIRGASAATLALGATARGMLGMRGTGRANLEIGAKAGIPHPKLVPNVFAPTHSSRQIGVDTLGNAIEQPATPRTFNVPIETRTFHVSPEREE